MQAGDNDFFCDNDGVTTGTDNTITRAGVTFMARHLSRYVCERQLCIS